MVDMAGMELTLKILFAVFAAVFFVSCMAMAGADWALNLMMLLWGYK